MYLCQSLFCMHVEWLGWLSHYVLIKELSPVLYLAENNIMCKICLARILDNITLLLVSAMHVVCRICHACLVDIILLSCHDGPHTACFNKICDNCIDSTSAWQRWWWLIDKNVHYVEKSSLIHLSRSLRDARRCVAKCCWPAVLSLMHVIYVDVDDVCCFMLW